MHGNGNILATYQQKANHLLHSWGPLHPHVLETRTQLNVSLTIVQRPDRLFRSHNLVPESPQTPCLRQPRWNLPLQSRVGVGRQLPVAQVRTTRATVLLLEVRLQNKRCTHQPRQLQLQALSPRLRRTGWKSHQASRHPREKILFRRLSRSRQLRRYLKATSKL